MAEADDDDVAKTRLEPYPQLNSVQQDEAIAWLKGAVDLLAKRVDQLEKKLG